MMNITFKSYLDWEDYAKTYCEETVECIYEMPEQDEIDTIVDDVLYQGFSTEYGLCVNDVDVPAELKEQVERGVRAYITDQIKEHAVPATVFETICDALDDSGYNEWSKIHLKESKQYTKADLCRMLHDWLDVNIKYDIY